MKNFSNNTDSVLKMGTFVGAIFTGLFGAAIGVSNLVKESNKIKDENAKNAASTEALPAPSTENEQKWYLMCERFREV